MVKIKCFIVTNAFLCGLEMCDLSVLCRSVWIQRAADRLFSRENGQSERGGISR